VVSSTPRPQITPGKDPVPIIQEAEWAPGTGGKSLPHRDFILREYYRLINLCKSPPSKPGYHISCVEQEATSRKLLILSERDKSECTNPKFHPIGAGANNRTL
jgi:hypothetical protein